MLSTPKREYFKNSESFFIFIWTFLFFAFFSSGYIDATDAEPSLDLAKAIVQTGHTRIYPGVENTYFEYRLKKAGPDRFFYFHSSEGWYSKMGLGMAALYLPAAASARIWRKLQLPVELWVRFVASFTNCALTALIVSGLYAYARRKSHTCLRSILFSFATGFGTYLFAYSKMSHREPLEALCLAGAYFFALVNSGTSFSASLRSRAYSGIFAALGILTKEALVVPLIPALGLALVDIGQSRRRHWQYLALTLPLLLGGLIWMAYAQVAFGSWSASGYSPAVNQLHSNVWRTPFLTGIREQWIGWRYGIIFFSPIVLLPLAYLLWEGWRRLNRLQLACLFSIGLQTALYARWISPIGAEALGARYLVPVIPLLALFAEPFLTIWVNQRRWQIAGLSLLVLSFLMQAVNVSVKPAQYWIFESHADNKQMDPQWWVNTKLFLHKAAGRPEIYTLANFGINSSEVLDLRKSRSLVGFNFWWLRRDWVRELSAPQGASTGQCTIGG